jgi:ATP-dependent DNA helicase RecG
MTHILDKEIEFCKGVGPARAEALKKDLSIFTLGDLLKHFPFRYVDRSKFHSIREVSDENSYYQIKGRFTRLEQAGTGRSTRLIGTFTDGESEIELLWFGGIKWMLQKLKPGIIYIVFGKASVYGNRYNMVHPDIEAVNEFDNEPLPTGLQPVYSSTEKLKSKGLDSRGISKILKTSMPDLEGKIPENLSISLISRLRLISRESAFMQIHFPENQSILDKAIARLKFEELFFIQLRLLRQKFHRTSASKGFLFEKVGTHFHDFYKNYLPFELTNAQKRVIREIRTDMGSGKQMNRLLQGDVGSGKTLVALMTMLIAIDNGFQASLMAPTEILARQHFINFSNLLEKTGLRIEFLTGNTKAAERRRIHESLENGNTHILIGTHALIEDDVKFRNLGLAVIDEQHRFGVAQRARMWSKNEQPPHVMVMTATPIPRTLAMTLYGDLDTSVIDEMPPGRKPVKTYHYTDAARLRVFGFMKDQIRQGRQIYVVYPLIFESESLDLKHLMDGFESIERAFPLPEYAVSMVHGKLKPAIRDYEMKRFITGETQIMVATTVIEVGVDIPNASVMVIENAERFGLSQLHQLRGRVGRGADQSYCILMTGDKLGSEARQRIDTMVRTQDGFEIAEADLRLRGPGDIDGLRQSGIVDLKLADIVKDEAMMKSARNLASEILNLDPRLEKEENRPLKNYLNSTDRLRNNWAMIS